MARRLLVMLLFIYGTLKRGCSNHHYMAGQRFVAMARTAPDYRLVSMGTYPGMVHSQPGRSIQGEVWEVDAGCLQRLDILEGVEEGEYAFEPVPLLAPFDGGTVHGYVYLKDVQDRPDAGEVWCEG